MEREELILGITADIESAKANLATLQGQLDELSTNWDLPALETELVADVDNAQQVVDDLEAELGDALEMPIKVTGVEGAKDKIDEVGTSAGNAGTAVGGLNGAFNKLIGAMSLMTVANKLLNYVTDKFREHQADIAKQDAFDSAQVDAYADALRLAGDEAENLVDVLEGAGAVTASFFGQEFDITEDLADANITADEFIRTLREDGVDGLNAMVDAAHEAGVSQDGLRRITIAGSEQLANYGQATEEAAAANEVFAETQVSANAALQQVLDKQDPMRRFTDEWALLVESISDGSLDTTAAAGALNTLTDGLNLTTDQVLELAQAEVDRVFEEAAAGAQAFSDAVSDVDFQTADLTGATSAFSDYTTGLFAAENQVQATEAAFDALTASAEGQALTFDVGTDAGRAQQDALEGVARVLDTDLAQAYVDADGDQVAFMETARTLGEETLTRLKDELGLTDEQVAAVGETLGLTEGDYEARFNLAGAAEAQIQLGLLGDAIAGLPADVETTVTQQILTGDYVAARDTVANYYADNPVPLEGEVKITTQPVVKVTLEPVLSEAFSDTDKLLTGGGTQKLEFTSTITAEADTAEAEDDLEAVASADRTATIDTIAETGDADVELDQVAAAERIATITADAETGAADAEIDRVAAQSRTAIIDVATGSISLPSAGDLARRIGTVHIPVQAYWNTRIEGRRPI